MAEVEYGTWSSPTYVVPIAMYNFILGFSQILLAIIVYLRNCNVVPVIHVSI